MLLIKKGLLECAKQNIQINKLKKFPKYLAKSFLMQANSKSYSSVAFHL